MDEKISIIVPVNNTDAYLRFCLDTILEQSYQNFEAILIDDGSEDFSYQICQEYAKKDQRIRVFRMAHAGVGAARNLGLEKATGEYITFIDSDDYVSPDYLAKMYEMIKKYHVKVVVGDYYRYNDKTNLLSYRVVDKDYSEKVLTPEQVVHQLNQETWLAAGWKLFAAPLFNDIGFPTGRSYGEDASTNLKLYLKTKRIVHVVANLYCYRVNEESVTKADWTTQIITDALSMYEDMFLELHLYDLVSPELNKMFNERLLAFQNFFEERELKNEIYLKVCHYLSLLS